MNALARAMRPMTQRLQLMIGRAVVTPLPDGRQQAELIAITIDQVGDRG